ncbi:MAG: DUF2493 domain-containing protein [Ruminococcaceae bacterium]|nr:DUF2493 domain-containing protein [Oscillospiraceae bacterium]
MKRIIIAECRNYTNYGEAKKYIDHSLSNIRNAHKIIVVSGGCKGADMIGERYAEENKFIVERYPAEWNKYGKKAGPIRNKIMAETADFIICFWDGKSKGTQSMIKYAKAYRKPLKIFLINNN